MQIVLLGSIPKGDEVRKDWLDWKEEYKIAIRAKLPDVVFLDGDAISDSAGAEMVVGHDLAMVRRGDVCVVDARAKVGAGTAQEMVIAKQFGKPVVTVIPRDSHYHKSRVTFHGAEMNNWIHPFMKVSSDYIASSIREATEWIEKYSKTPDLFDIKDMSVYLQAIDSYEKTTQ